MLSERLISPADKHTGSSSSKTTGLSNGGWVTVWFSHEDELGTVAVCAQRFDADGAMIGDRMVIDADVEDPVLAFDVHAQANGNWSLRWSEAEERSAPAATTHFRLFDEAGTQLSAWKYDGPERAVSGKEFADGTFLIGDFERVDGMSRFPASTAAIGSVRTPSMHPPGSVAAGPVTIVG